jgi:anaerobic selenocysteine-containing dehydrogenase
MVDLPSVKTCPRWRAQLDFVYHPDRLKYPLKRVGGRGEGNFVRISWDEALDTVAGEFNRIKQEYGPESVVFYIAYTKEPRPYFHRLTHAFGSPNYCTESSNCFTSTRLVAAVTYGSEYLAMVGQSQYMQLETRCKLIWSSSVEHSAPHVWPDHLKARKNGLKLIVVDPRRTRLASKADIHLQLRPGTDGALALGFLNVIIGEELYDKEFVRNWTVGFNELKELVREYTPERVEEITWVPAAKIKEAALLYATQKPSQVKFSAASTTHTSNGILNHRAIALLPAITGNLDVPGGNRCFHRRAPLNDITLHERIKDMPPGLGAERFPLWTELVREMQSNVITDRIENGTPYPIKALFGAGLNIMFFANSNRFAEKMQKLDFIVMTDYFHTPTTKYADILLPISSWLERHILVTNDRGYVKLVEPAIEPLGESWPEWKVYFKLAEKLGCGDEFWDGDIEKCFDYILEPSGITVEQLKQHPRGIHYPVKQRPDRYYENGGFKTPSGKVEIVSSVLEQYGYDSLPVYKEPMESPVSRPDLAKSYPLVLTSGSRTVAYTHSLYRNIPRLRKRVPDPLLEINPADAEERGIRSGDMVMVSSPRGECKLKAQVTDTILRGVVHAPHHWTGEANINQIIDDQNLDPISGFAPYKAQLCQVSKV